jgi:hypothetical protein
MNDSNMPSAFYSTLSGLNVDLPLGKKKRKCLVEQAMDNLQALGRAIGAHPGEVFLAISEGHVL